MSRLHTLVGLCQGDLPGLADYVNSAQRRLIMCREAGDEGWWGSWAEVAFTATRAAPYITCPREIARLEKLNVCQTPAHIQNQFYEYLNFGDGSMPKLYNTWYSCNRQVYSRNNVVMFRDLTSTPQIIRIRTDDAGDIGSAKRVLVQGVDNNGNIVRTQDGQNQDVGAWATVDSPFSDVADIDGNVIQWSAITGIQKDATTGTITLYQVDPVTGDEILLHLMKPSEETAAYRRYYLSNLPINCCTSATQSSCNAATVTTDVQVSAIAKLDLIPVAVDTDYCLIQNIEAIIEECQAIRYAGIDSGGARQLSMQHHQMAVRLLQGELVHFLGKEKPAVNFAPFGTAKLERHGIGTLI